jgi:hypothetical protein
MHCDQLIKDLSHFSLLALLESPTYIPHVFTDPCSIYGYFIMAVILHPNYSTHAIIVLLVEILLGVLQTQLQDKDEVECYILCTHPGDCWNGLLIGTVPEHCLPCGNY